MQAERGVNKFNFAIATRQCNDMTLCAVRSPPTRYLAVLHSSKQTKEGPLFGGCDGYRFTVLLQDPKHSAAILVLAIACCESTINVGRTSSTELWPLMMWNGVSLGIVFDSFWLLVLLWTASVLLFLSLLRRRWLLLLLYQVLLHDWIHRRTIHASGRQEPR